MSHLFSPWALSKNLFYTAITRAQKNVTVITSEFHMRRALTTEVHRTTRLGTRIAEAIAGNDNAKCARIF